MMFEDQAFLKKSWVQIVNEDEQRHSQQPILTETPLKQPPNSDRKAFKVFLNALRDSHNLQLNGGPVDPNYKDPMFMSQKEKDAIRKKREETEKLNPPVSGSAESKWAPKNRANNYSSGQNYSAKKWSNTSVPPPPSNTFKKWSNTSVPLPPSNNGSNSSYSNSHDPTYSSLDNRGTYASKYAPAQPPPPSNNGSNRSYSNSHAPTLSTLDNRGTLASKYAPAHLKAAAAAPLSPPESASSSPNAKAAQVWGPEAWAAFAQQNM